MDKRERAARFRVRLLQALEAAKMSQSALARQIGVERSTISQVVNSEDARLPNAHVVGECAAALNVSADWLLGLTDKPEQAGDLLRTSFSMTRAARAAADEEIFNWHQEATGYKIRHVPATLPDMLKTRGVLRWEYATHFKGSPKEVIAAYEERLDLLKGRGSDYEIAVPLHEIENFAAGQGYYQGLPADIRRKQLETILDVYDELFPALRVFLFDAKHIYSAPITVFGPLLAVVYIGQSYLIFRESERVRTLSHHFDTLVRESEIDARAIPDFLNDLIARHF
ncbi:helix-turn-helix transcriptional regulator [Pseudovibrio sp. SPO723]|uniref:helix-turn-helix domain-containing protein n=1 Tax=Nesiotobacter zosterae TaxID=392721 RepID=UPI0029C28278|nr:helix-turn-helix transcriptional regulator [Pseudovibrio sp. SPO723]MDX5593225.1 helix-turn-helix transcriptional regulator [Pseudovibrio sp. SPO723]